MNKTRFAVKCFAGTLAATVLLIGSFAAPAQAAKDSGWDRVGTAPTSIGAPARMDSGWDRP